MREEMDRDPRVFVMGEDIAARGGVFLATEGFVERFGEERVIDTTLGRIVHRRHSSGRRYARHASYRRDTVCRLHLAHLQPARWGGRPCTVRDQWSDERASRGQVPYGGGVRGGLYHSQSVEAFFAHTPGLKVVTPATPYDAKGLLKSAVRDDDPVIFLEHKRTYRLVRGEVPDGEYSLPIGKAEVKLEGDDMSVITYGLMLHHCLEAARALAQEGVSVEVVDLRTLRPLDQETVLDSVKKTGKALIVHEDNKAGGIGGEVAAIISEHAFAHLDGPVVRVAAAPRSRPCPSARR